jgi:hypothetical protein
MLTPKERKQKSYWDAAVEPSEQILEFVFVIKYQD